MLTSCLHAHKHLACMHTSTLLAYTQAPYTNNYKVPLAPLNYLIRYVMTSHMKQCHLRIEYNEVKCILHIE